MKFTCDKESIAGNSYAPPILGNGSIATQIDFRGEQRQFSYFRMVPGIYRAGRRYDTRKSELYPHGFFYSISALGEPVFWRETLHCDNAAVTTECSYGNGGSIKTTAFVHWRDNVLAIRKEFEGIDDYSLAYCFGWSIPGDLHMHGKYKTGVTEELTPEAPYAMDYHASAQGGALTIDYALLDKRKHQGRITLNVSAPGATWQIDDNCFKINVPLGTKVIDLLIIPTDCLDEAEASERACQWRKRSFDDLFADHKQVCADFWGQSRVDVPDKDAYGVYITALYGLRCFSTRWGIPSGLFPSHWNGVYFGFNNFTQALCCAGNFPEALKVPAFRHSTLAAAVRRASAKSFETAGARFPHQSDEQGNELSGAGFWVDHIFQMGCVAMEAWNFYEYHPDKEYLQAIGYPLLFNCAQFYMRNMVYELKDGRTVIGRCADLERLGPARENAFLTTCSAISTMERAADGADILDCDRPYAENWRRTAQKLREHLPHDGTKYIPVPDCTETSIGLAGALFPFTALPRHDWKLLAALDDFAKRHNEAGNMYHCGNGMCTWYASWLALVRCKTGSRDAYDYLKMAVNNRGCFAEVFEINEPGIHVSIPWGTAIAGAYARAFQTMLLDCEDDAIRIGQGVPRDWQQWRFTLRAPDDLLVTAKFENSACKMAITAGTLYSGRPKTVIAPDGKMYNIQPAAGTTIDLNSTEPLLSPLPKNE